ncbi:hypothetical protein [Actinomadura napierensis]|uniref:Uncharacterized protein n=1 Tax=Actinomadura napierensis TaxID=267854 RepID=A0ABP5LTF1_9ACTN
MAVVEGDHAFHVVGGKRHGLFDQVAGVARSGDRQNGDGQPPGLAPLVLRDGGVERAVEREAGAQGVGVGGEGTDVAFDGVVGELADGLGGDLVPDEDALLALDEQLGEAVEGEMPEPVVGLGAVEERR